MEEKPDGSSAKDAGLAGDALRSGASILEKVIDKSDGLANPERAALLNRIALGVFLLGGAGILAWVLTGNKGPTVTGAPCGYTVSGSVSGGSINCGAVPTTTGGGK